MNLEKRFTLGMEPLGEGKRASNFAFYEKKKVKFLRLPRETTLLPSSVADERSLNGGCPSAARLPGHKPFGCEMFENNILPALLKKQQPKN